MLNLGTCSKSSNQHRLYYDKRLVLSAKITRCYQLNWLIISSSSWADSAFAVLNSASSFWVGSGLVVEDHWTYEMLRECNCAWRIVSWTYLRPSENEVVTGNVGFTLPNCSMSGSTPIPAAGIQLAGIKVTMMTYWQMQTVNMTYCWQRQTVNLTDSDYYY